MRFISLLFVIALLTCSANKEVKKDSLEIPDSFIKCLDISYIPEIESNGGKFYINGKESDFFDILNRAGINTVRIRLWNNHPEGEASLNNMIELAKRAKKRGMKFLLNFHYSDTWADPQNQSKPTECENLSFEKLQEALKQYTFDVISKCIENDVYPDYVQTGNEISVGFLWDTGKIGGLFNDNWPNFITLLKSALEGVKMADSQNHIKTIIHHHTGSDYNHLDWYFDNITDFNVDYNMIGVSYYPFFSNDTINKLKETVMRIGTKYKKQVFIVETAYPWTKDYFDNTHNVFGKDSFILPEYSATPNGQKLYMRKFLDEMFLSGIVGVAYWGGEWISVEGHGSMWENLSLFDFEGNALPAILMKW